MTRMLRERDRAISQPERQFVVEEEVRKESLIGEGEGEGLAV
jgi:hypothetical protein